MGHTIISAPTPGASQIQIDVRKKIANEALTSAAQSELRRQARIKDATADKIRNIGIFDVYRRATGSQWAADQLASEKVLEDFSTLLDTHANTPDKHHYSKAFAEKTKELASRAYSADRLAMLRKLEEQFGSHRIPPYFTNALAKVLYLA